MPGAVQQLELFTPKPKLQDLDGQVIPQSFVASKRFAFIKGDAKLQGTKRKFAQHGQSGQTISECLPHLATIADDICMLRAVKTDVFNHGPAKFFMNTGSPLFGRPSLGSWTTYGLGSESENLPAFVVFSSGSKGPSGGNSIVTICWHVGGNLRSRFTDFLTSDGEKPWRQRDEEFAARTVTGTELLAHWNTGWDALLATLATLSDADLGRSVTIRGKN